MTAGDPWQKLVNEEEFQNSIDKQGYYASQLSFQPFLKKYNLSVKGRAPTYLSRDFWSGQSKTLIQKRCYVIRTGKGRFVIFNEDRFPKPYLDLNLNDVKEEILTGQIYGYVHMKKAFQNHYHEDANLEHLRLVGGFDELLSRLLGTREYRIGPRGNRSSKFKLYFFSNDSASRIQFDYDGQEEMDYTIWTEDSVLVFEAKQFRRKSSNHLQTQESSKLGTDIGWHKLAYPCYRFHDYSGLNVYPVYYLRIDNVIYVFVFEKMKFESDGILLNDSKHYRPLRSFKIAIC